MTKRNGDEVGIPRILNNLQLSTTFPVWEKGCGSLKPVRGLAAGISSSFLIKILLILHKDVISQYQNVAWSAPVFVSQLSTLKKKIITLKSHWLSKCHMYLMIIIIGPCSGRIVTKIYTVGVTTSGLMQNRPYCVAGPGSPDRQTWFSSLIAIKGLMTRSCSGERFYTALILYKVYMECRHA